MQKRILFLGLCVLILAGCATSTSYVNFTSQRFVPKDQSYIVNVYPATQTLGTANPYYVIGKFSIEGFASSGVSPETLIDRAKVIARKRGADAVINAKTEAFRYYGGDLLLRLKGELIVYASTAAK